MHPTKWVNGLKAIEIHTLERSYFWYTQGLSCSQRYLPAYIDPIYGSLEDSVPVTSRLDYHQSDLPTACPVECLKKEWNDLIGPLQSFDRRPSLHSSEIGTPATQSYQQEKSPWSLKGCINAYKESDAGDSNKFNQVLVERSEHGSPFQLPYE